MLDPADFLEVAQGLPVGGRARIGHDCGPGHVLLVNHKPEGYSAYCFRCDEAGWVKKVLDLKALAEARRARQAADEEIGAAPDLPQPMEWDVAEWPLQARVWLYKAGLGKPEIARLGAYYHPDSRRVVLPVLEDDRVVYWQARAVEPGHNPKYLNPDVGRRVVLPKFGDDSMIVLTEDILSAYRVGEAGEGWSLMGVKLQTPVLSRVLKDGRPVTVWLDPDRAGRVGAAKILRDLESAGIPCHKIDSEYDPKNHSREEVSSILADARRLLVWQ